MNAARLAARSPRGGLRFVKAIASLRPGLRNYPLDTRYGVVCCDLRESVCFPLLRYGEYPHWRVDEPAWEKLLELCSGRVVFDVGANIGVLTRMFAQRAMHVHAFEPAPRALELLAANTRDLPNVTIHPVALSDGANHVRFNESEALDTSSISLDGSGVEVAASTIDATELLPDLIKIDVEGFEDRVLRGATKTLRSGPVIAFEALDDDARDRCEQIILSANPGYAFESMPGKTNVIAWPGELASGTTDPKGG